MPTNPETKKRKREFVINYIKNVCSALKTCEDLGIDIFEFYLWLRADEKFKQDIFRAREIIFDEIEANVYKKALVNPNIGLKVLERHRPDRWGDISKLPKKEIESEVKNLLPAEFYYITKDQFKELADQILKQQEEIYKKYFSVEPDDNRLE